MIEFEFLKSKINKTDYDFPTLIWDGDLRTKEGQIIYQNYKEELIKNNILPFEQIKNEIFPDDNSPKYFFKLENCQFPYDLVNIRFHYILWINSNDPQIIKKALEFEKIRFAGENYIFFQNEPKNKSVPEITHFHFLVK